MEERDDVLPFHRAIKKTPHVDDSGRAVDPDEPNALKFERFIFDLMPHALGALAIEVDRAEAFAPVKNASGAAADTPETAQALMIARHRRWLERAGAQVQPGVAVEVSPFFALDAAELAEKVAPGLVVREPTFFE
jgi:UDP-N-acetylglucosamine/UDP-N-acetylgalactosamine diphosphorylase